MSEKVIKLKTSDLPLLVELEAPNGYIDYLEMKLTKGRIGAYLNRVSKPLRKFISRSK
jgi:hypothetical protein